MNRPTLAAVLLSGLLYALASATPARAQSYYAGASDPGYDMSRIDSLCRPYSPSPCLVRASATLRSATSGGPLWGKRMRFVAGNTVLCTATTDESGRAACLGVAPSGQSLAQTGYRAGFDGDERYWADSAVVRASVRRTAASE